MYKDRFVVINFSNVIVNYDFSFFIFEYVSLCVGMGMFDGICIVVVFCLCC